MAIYLSRGKGTNLQGLIAPLNRANRLSFTALK